MATGDLVIQVAVGGTQPLGGGLKVVTGGALINTYNGAGVGSMMNLANFYSSSSQPLVMLGPANGYMFVHTGGRADNGRVRAFYTVMQVGTQSNTSYNTASGEVPDGTALCASTGTINIPFIAIGRPF